MFERRNPNETRREARETVLSGGTPEGTPYYDYPVFGNGTTSCGTLPRIDELDELQCRYDSHLSFYGKAHTWRTDDGVTHLLSYRTEVMRCDRDGNLSRLHGQPQSNTTSRHMKEFARQFVGASMSVGELRKLPTFDSQELPDCV